VAQILDIDHEGVEIAIQRQFSKKAKAAALNLSAAKAGFEYAKASLPKQDRFLIERSNKTPENHRGWELGCGPGSGVCRRDRW